MKKKKGFYLPLVLLLSAVAVIISVSILTLAFGNFAAVRRQSRSTSALSIAEAGVNYYLWHLAHNNKDYCDGNPCSGSGPYGPYTHTYKDTFGSVIGSFTLTVTPPPTNGSSVDVRSVGQTSTGENRTILATLGIPSFAHFAYVTNSETWFGSTSSTPGPVHSNVGIHFDGTANDTVSAASQTYLPSSCYGGTGITENGVWGSGGPQSYWQFPVPQIDFNHITTDLNTLQAAAQNGGVYLPKLINGKNKKTYSGYAIRLNADKTFTVGDVTASTDTGGSTNSCTKHSSYNSLMQSVVWETSNRPMPTDGVIFVADNVWVWGTVTTRLTIASGRLPENSSTYTNVFLQDNITYSAKDGSVVLGVIGQSDVVINSSSADTLELDGFYLSQKGKVFRPYYPSNIKTSLTFYGGIGSNSWWGWNWLGSNNQVISGYQQVNSTYDPYISKEPPPLFPTTGSFSVLSWREEPIL